MIRAIAQSTILAAGLFLGASTAHAAGCDAPAPKVQPGAVSDIPAEAASLAGTWRGVWPVVSRQHVYPRCAVLVVNVTGAQAATVEQCVGSVSAARLKPECKQYVGQIAGNELTFTDLAGTIYSFTLADVGGMLAKQVSAEHRSVSNFNKTE